STLPVSKSRPGLTMARRNLCSIVQAALYFFSPSTRCSPNALAPFFCVVTHHIARNHTGKGMRVSWKIVPAVTEVWHPHAAHSHKPRTGLRLAAGTTETGRPPKSRQVRPTRIFGGEVRLQLHQITRILFHHHGILDIGLT